MKKAQINIEKVCNFYVSDWHLAVMLLPYVSYNLKNGKKIFPIFQNDMGIKVKQLLERLNVTNTEEIKQLNWNKTQIDKVNIEDTNDSIFIVNGNNKYIEIVNEKINNKCNNCKVVNCFSLDEFGVNMQNILVEYNKILNTSGEKDIEEFLRQEEKKKIS